MSTQSALKQGFERDALKVAIGRALENVFADPDQIPMLFTDDYVQTTDGVTSNRKEFEEHIRHVVSVVQEIRFEVLDAVQQGDNIADRHLVHVTYNDGRRATIEVYLFGTTYEGRLQRVHEVTRTLAGDEALRELAKARG